MSSGISKKGEAEGSVVEEDCSTCYAIPGHHCTKGGRRKRDQGRCHWIWLHFLIFYNGCGVEPVKLPNKHIQDSTPSVSLMQLLSGLIGKSATHATTEMYFTDFRPKLSIYCYELLLLF